MKADINSQMVRDFALTRQSSISSNTTSCKIFKNFMILILNCIMIGVSRKNYLTDGKKKRIFDHRPPFVLRALYVWH